MTEPLNNRLYKALLGNHKDLNEALNATSKGIAEIARRDKTQLSFPSVKRNGISITKLYDFTPK